MKREIKATATFENVRFHPPKYKDGIIVEPAKASATISLYGDDAKALLGDLATFSEAGACTIEADVYNEMRIGPQGEKP